MLGARLGRVLVLGVGHGGGILLLFGSVSYYIYLYLLCYFSYRFLMYESGSVILFPLALCLHF
jgi:hypothetical protein